VTLSNVVSGVALAAALIAFAVTVVLSLRAQVEPLYAVLRSIGAFLGVLWAARWGARVVEALGGGSETDDTLRSGDASPRSTRRGGEGRAGS